MKDVWDAIRFDETQRLNQIMSIENFSPIERALVWHSDLSESERVKIISEIKIAKSNDRYSRKIAFLTFVLAFTGIFDVFGSQIETVQPLWKKVLLAIPTLFLVGMLGVHFLYDERRNK